MQCLIQIENYKILQQNLFNIQNIDTFAWYSVAGKQSGKYTGYLNTTLLFQDFCFHGTATKLGNNLWNDKKRKTNYHFLYLKTKLLLRLYNENFLQEIPSFNIKKKPRLHSQIYTELWPLPWFTTCISQWSHNHQWKKGWALKSAYSYIHNTLQCVAFIFLAYAYNTLLFFKEIDFK